MTLTLDLTPELEARLQALAAERGVAVEAAATQVLTEGILSEAELDAAQDARDADAAARAIAATDSSQWRSLDDLRKAIRG